MGAAQDTITVAWSGVADAGAVVDLLLPARVGSVRLVRELGRGGMGVVWLGHDELLGRHVAVKFLAGAVATTDDPGFARFLEGARAAAEAQHASLNAIHTAGLVDASGQSVPYLVMQYVDGPTLAQVLARCGKLTLAEVLPVMSAICEGVGQLHDRSIVHRDIKPSNILLDAQGRVIVTDFGLSHRRHAPGAAGVFGTPGYMAPEMFAGEVSARSDVYALSMTAYELLTGSLAFKGTLDEVKEKHQSAPLPAEPLRDAGVSDAVIELLGRAAHKQAVFRHKAARQFWRALATAAGNYKPDPTRQANLVAQLVSRTTGQTAAAIPAAGAPTPPADASPSPRSFYETIGAAAQAKRAARVSIEPPPAPEEALAAQIPAPATPVTAASTVPTPPPLPAAPAAATPAVVVPAVFLPPQAPPAHPAPKPVPSGGEHVIHCLNCGYDRFGLAPDAPCPECGMPDITDQQLRQCASGQRKLFRRFLLLRAPPVGWWEVFRTPIAGAFGAGKAWLTVLLAVLISVVLTAAFETIFHGLIIEWNGKAYLYRDGDPKKAKVHDYGSGMMTYSYFDRDGINRRDRMLPTAASPVPGMRTQVLWTHRLHFNWPRPIEYFVYMPLLGLMLVFPWVMYRYGWLNWVLWRRTDLPQATRDAMRRAANAHAVLHASQCVWLLVFLLLAFPLVALTNYQKANQWVWWIWMGLNVTFPLAVWWRTLAADRGRRLFDARARPALLAVAGVQVLVFLLLQLIKV